MQGIYDRFYNYSFLNQVYLRLQGVAEPVATYKGVTDGRNRKSEEERSPKRLEEVEKGVLAQRNLIRKGKGGRQPLRILPSRHH
jgi:hypothetical protein